MSTHHLVTFKFGVEVFAPTIGLERNRHACQRQAFKHLCLYVSIFIRVHAKVFIAFTFEESSSHSAEATGIERPQSAGGESAWENCCHAFFASRWTNVETV